MSELDERLQVVTGAEGSENFPANENDVMDLIETLAVQNIRGLKSTNSIVDGFYEYNIENGKVIEEAVIEMAEPYVFDKNAYDRIAKDPSVKVRYFNNFEGEQYQATIRQNDIRKIITNKGVGVEDVVSVILDTLTQGEGHSDFLKMRNGLFSAQFKNYREILGGVPTSMKGVIYALRDMYNHLKYDNNDLTAYEYVSSTREEDIRIAVTPKLLNLIDVKELASIFNLEKEQLFGKIVVVPTDDLDDDTHDGFAFVYDVKALGKATRLKEFSQEKVAKGLYMNEYLTVERAYFHNGLFKGCYLDCSEAMATDKASIIGNPTTYTVTKTLTKVTTTSDITSVVLNEPYVATFVCDDGSTLSGASSIATLTMGGEDIASDCLTIASDKKSAIVNIPYVKGNVVVTLKAVV